MPSHPLSYLIASRLNSIRFIEKHSGRAQEPVIDRLEDEITRMVKAFMPSGSGVDSGTTIDMEQSNDRKIVFNTAFHHMDEHGGYDGWTEHTITFHATFSSPNISISGKNRNDIKEYLADIFENAFNQKVAETWHADEQRMTFQTEHGWTA